MKIRLLPVLLVVVLSCCNCSKQKAADDAAAERASPQDVAGGDAPADGPELAGNDAAFYHDPMHVGHRRDYLMLVTQGAAGTQKYHVSCRIDETEEVGGKVYHKWVVDMGGFPEGENWTQLERRSPDACYAILEKDDSRTEFMTSPLRLEPGMQWTVSPPGRAPVERCVVGYETLTLLGVTYADCLKVKVESEDRTGYIWYAPGVGEVKAVYDYGAAVMTYILKPSVQEDPAGGNRDGD